MESLPLFFIKDWRVLSIIPAIIMLYTWSICWRVSYCSFLLGAFTMLVLEAIFLWCYLAGRIKKQSGNNITVELGNIVFPVNIYSQ